MSRRNHNGFGDLCEKYLMRGLSPKEIRELEQNLQDDPDAREYFFESVRDELILHRVHRRAHEKIISLKHKTGLSKRIRLVAAAITILFSLGGLIASRMLSVQLSPAEGVGELGALAAVTEFHVEQQNAIQAVNTGRGRQLSLGAELYDGDQVVLPANAYLKLKYLNEETTVEFNSGTLFRIYDDAGSKRIHLSYGRLRADVAKQAEAYPMVVSTHDARMVVLGTSFDVLKRETTRLRVHSGQVRFITARTGQSQDVSAGHMATSKHSSGEDQDRLVESIFKPTLEKTLNIRPKDDHPKYIAVDPVRNYRGLIQFDLGDVEGEIIEARLQLQVIPYNRDLFGSGVLRVYRLETAENPDGDRTEVVQYKGNLAAWMDLTLIIEADKLKPGLNNLLIMLDEGGNDFWFSSSRGPRCPELIITRRTVAGAAE